MSRIYLIRHGRPSAVWGGADHDPGLDLEGQAQAALAAKALFALPVNERPTMAVSSPMRRCLETAKPFVQAIGGELEVADAVSEIPTPQAGGDRSGWLGRALRGRWSEITGDIDYSAWRAAVLAAVTERPGAAIFTHFVAINAVVSKLMGVDDVTVFRPGHASITVLEVHRGQLEIVRQGTEAATGVL
ncbi:MAG TPA: histidine phosphatase family protein [Caulobacteraceae bacterium]|nr:histidine phosphatase family protein [Caulobacteraceae bacterium]